MSLSLKQQKEQLEKQQLDLLVNPSQPLDELKAKYSINSHGEVSQRLALLDKSISRLTAAIAEEEADEAKAAEDAPPRQQNNAEYQYNIKAMPCRLLSTSGAAWQYQRDDEMELLIAEEVEAHYKHWIRENPDKLLHPLFLACGGVGTGKSRLLMELPGIVKRTAQNEELKKRLQTAFIFNVSFENGTPADGGNTFASLDHEIGTRMMFQMVLGDNKSWSLFRSDEGNHKSIGQVVEFLAHRSGSCKFRDLTIFLMVDGIQKLHHEGKSKDTPLYQCVATVAGCVNETSSAFMLCCCSATMVLPIVQVLADSPQRSRFLSPRQLDGTKVIEAKGDPTLELLVEDMGGHGRALESLQEAIDNVRKVTELEHYGFSTLANDVRVKLETLYPDSGYANLRITTKQPWLCVFQEFRLKEIDRLLVI